MANRITKIDLGESYAGKIRMREVLYEERKPTAHQLGLLDEISEHRYSSIASGLLSHHLSYEAAFTAACYALRASNARLDQQFFQDGKLDDFGDEGNALAAREVLSGLAHKEAWYHLAPDEVAGLVTAAMLDIMRFPAYGDRVIETCGMGGDRGITKGDTVYKTINGSTLSALVLASLGIPTAKHGSYGNTSPVGSTNAIEQLGVIVDIPSIAAQDKMVTTGFHYTDAHGWKTIHDLSHLPPRRETVNHVIGPMTPPVGPTTRLDKVIGVNDKLHPAIIAHAYVKLGERGVFLLGNVAVVGGLSSVVSKEKVELHHPLREHIILDELSPVASAVSFVRKGQFAGTHVVTPRDFGTDFPNVLAPFILSAPSTVYAANRSALNGEIDGRQLVDLLAMNAALGLYLVRFMDDDVHLRKHGPSREALQDCFRVCRNALVEGRVRSFVDTLVNASVSCATE